MPQPVRSRLAKACQGLQLPAGAVVFKEDDKGDSMFVVVSGCLQVRARPLQSKKTQNTLSQAQDMDLSCQQALSATGTAVALQGGSVLQDSSPQEGLAGGGMRRCRATTDAACTGGSSSLVTGGGGRAAAAPQACHRTTWEGVAFTAKEQGRLEAVRTALDAEKLQVSAHAFKCISF